MPLLADFITDLQGDRIVLPAEIAGQLAGAGRVRVRIETPSPEPELLSARGIDAATVAKVAEVQKVESGIASMVMAGEGIASGTPLAARLRALVAPASSAKEGR